MIRLNLRANPPKFYDDDGKEVALTISPGETVFLHQVWYMGKVCMNVVGTWKKGLTEPMWVMTNLEPKRGLRIYFARMKIEETYRDLKSLLGMTKLMNKQQVYMEKMVSLLLLTFTIGLLVGEELRDLLYGEPIAEDEQVDVTERIPGAPSLKKGKKWKRYSGLFVLLKQKWTLSPGAENCCSGCRPFYLSWLGLPNCPIFCLNLRKIILDKFLHACIMLHNCISKYCDEE